ncbi:MAG: hypothetical protein IKS68_03410, partial [Mailhella sp.]|nr:hypothetical protein [Mailhella sp.]
EKAVELRKLAGEAGDFLFLLLQLLFCHGFSFGDHAVTLPDTSSARFVPRQKVFKKHPVHTQSAILAWLTSANFFALLLKQLSVLFFSARLAGKQLNRKSLESIIIEDGTFSGMKIAKICIIHC